MRCSNGVDDTKFQQRQARQSWSSQVALARLCAALGRRDEARERYRAAQTIIAGLRSRTGDSALRTALETSGPMREIEERAR